MFRTDGETDGAGPDALVFQFLRGELGMSGGCGMNHQALDVRHIGQQGEDLQMVDEGPGFLLAAFDFKGLVCFLLSGITTTPCSSTSENSHSCMHLVV